jgi:hypothetical protein
LWELGKDYSSSLTADFKKPNSALLLLLQSVNNESEKLVLCNTQLYNGDKLDFVRQAQALYIMERASDFIRRHHITEAQKSLKDKK